ncbi:ABC transporter substrate-binding protein [Anaerolineales bacterium HSG24]|nr:ABC transporter substrate-binding protein [Anaerolineales bacterium HSG24]
MLKQMFVPMLLVLVLIVGCNTAPQITPEPKPTETELPTDAETETESNTDTELETDSGKMRVTFLNPGISDPNDPTGGFWLGVSAFMQATAEDLDINLEILYSERDHLVMQEQALEVATRDNPPDYLLVVNEKLVADKMVKVADEAGVKLFIMLNSFVDDQVTEMGEPREKYPNWIGSLIPDNHAAGYAIAKSIIEQGLANDVMAEDGTLHIIAVTGDRVTPASVQRVDGLEEALAEYDNVTLHQTFVGEWSKDKSKEQAQVGLKRYPETSVIWAANDPMALGTLDAAVEAGRIPGEDIFIGGLNWDGPALEKVQDGSMVMSVGGHFMTGGWSLILLHDYHQGKDFAEEGVALKRPIFSVIDSQNIEPFMARFGDRDWSQIDFTRFSKVLNPDVEIYDFSLDAILVQ